MPQKVVVLWLPKATSALILEPNAMEATFDHVLLLLMVLQQQKYVSSEIYTSRWSPIAPRMEPKLLTCPTDLLVPRASV